MRRVYFLFNGCVKYTQECASTIFTVIFDMCDIIERDYLGSFGEAQASSFPLNIFYYILLSVFFVVLFLGTCLTMYDNDI